MILIIVNKFKEIIFVDSRAKIKQLNDIHIGIYFAK